MRVITGSAGGRRLLELEGLETRPTTDRVKEAIFSSIQFEIEGRRVLDLFGGTGQMGIEALSRGATHCTFVDLSKPPGGGDHPGEPGSHRACRTGHGGPGGLRRLFEPLPGDL